MTDGDPLTFTVKEADRKAVESRIRELLDGLEKQGKYDYLLDVRKSGDDWRGTVVVNFHKKRYNESQKRSPKPNRSRGFSLLLYS